MPLSPQPPSSAPPLHPQGDLHFQADQILRASPDAAVIIDGNWTFTYANPQAFALLGVSDFIGTDIFTRFPGNAEEPFASNYRRSMLDRVPTQFEAFNTAPLNRWYRVRAHPLGTSDLIVFFSDITEQRLAERERDRSMAQLQQVFDATSDGILALDRSYTITFLNQSGAEILGSVPNALGQHIWHAFPHPSPTAVELYRRAMEDRVPADGVEFYADPVNIWVDLRIRPSDDGVVAFFRDITAEREAEAARLASEARYRVLSELNPQFLWMSSPAGEITYANPRFLAWLNVPELPRNTAFWLSILRPEDRTGFRDLWQRSAASGEELSQELLLRNPATGASRWFVLRSLPVRDDAGTILHWIGVATDIHEVRQNAEALHAQRIESDRQRAELETLYQSTPVGLGLVDPIDLRYLRVNDELARLNGLPREGMLGRTVHEVNGVAAFPELLREAARGFPVRNHLLHDLDFLHRPGEPTSLNVSYFPIYDPAGAIAGITIASLDITQQHRTEAALMRSEKLAAVGRLASSISHEINNPLEAITNLLYLVLLDGTLAPETHHYITLAQGELSRVSQIATQTLRFHRQAVRPTRVSPAQLLDAVLNLYQGRLSNSGIHVEACYSTARTVLCYENDIRQVLNNLIGNAIDAMRSGGRLLLRAHQVTDHSSGRRGLRLTVADTGHGMAPATIRRIFEPFFTTKGLSGTGLGLWISTEIVHRHHGRLTLRSSQHPVHHGTVFTLFLPDETPDQTPDAPSGQPRNQPKNETTNQPQPPPPTSSPSTSPTHPKNLSS